MNLPGDECMSLFHYYFFDSLLSTIEEERHHLNIPVYVCNLVIEESFPFTCSIFVYKIIRLI